MIPLLFELTVKIERPPGECLFTTPDGSKISGDEWMDLSDDDKVKCSVDTETLLDGGMDSLVDVSCGHVTYTNPGVRTDYDKLFNDNFVQGRLF